MLLQFRNISYLVLVVGLFVSCNKRDEFLGEKPDQSLATLSSLEILEKLLDNTQVFNARPDPIFGQLSSDDYYVTVDMWQSVSWSQPQYNGYVWAKDIFPVDYNSSDWSAPYEQIYNANIVLEALNNIGTADGDQERRNKIQGAALFFRAYAHFKLMQIFTLPYDKSLAGELLGIPIRLNTSISETVSRPSQQYCYDQIVADMKDAVSLLPVKSQIITRPSKTAVYGMLSRIYLSISDYENAKLYADSFLLHHNILTDFNDLQSDPIRIQPSTEPYLVEDVFHSTFGGANLTSFRNCIVDSTLYQLYDTNDLRKSFYFTVYNNELRFKGSFESHVFGDLFSGIATGEVLLNRAEANIRLNHVQEGVDDINMLLANRYITGEFTDLTAGSQAEAMAIVLNERRKELCFRGIRWLDLRRLNKEPEHAVTLKRILGTQEFTLPPDDKRYALPIPFNEISVSHIEQNQR